MIKAEVRDIIDRYEALLRQVLQGESPRRFPCPLEVIGDELLACEPECALYDDAWAQIILRVKIPDLKSL